MKTLTEIHGVEVDIEGSHQRKYLQVIEDALSHIEKLAASKELIPRQRDMRIAFAGALQSVNALLSAGSAKCNLAVPPEDIEVTQDAAGALILRCYHSPSHKWGWDGKPIP